MNNQKQLWDTVHSDVQILKDSQAPTEFSSTFLSLIKPNSKILELGCGVGNDSIAFAEARHEVLATDLSEIAVEKNRERFEDVSNVTFQTLDMNLSFPFEDAVFDAVYARLSLHYFTDEVTKRIFLDIHRVLKPEGVLVFMCKSTTDVLYGKGEKIEEDMFENKGHVRHFFSEAYTKACLSSLFTVISVEERTDQVYGKTSTFIQAVAQNT